MGVVGMKEINIDQRDYEVYCDACSYLGIKALPIQAVTAQIHYETKRDWILKVNADYRKSPKVDYDVMDGRLGN